MEWVLTLLVLHGAVGGLDVVLNHELVERLPARHDAVREQALHSAREALFAALFLALAWFAWHGAFSWLIVALVAAEVGVSAWDSVVEDRTRRLLPAERLMHVFLLVNLGAYIALLAPILYAWHFLPSGVDPAFHGWRTVLLTVLSCIAGAWSVRDALSYVQLRRFNQARTGPAIRQ